MDRLRACLDSSLDQQIDIEKRVAIAAVNAANVYRFICIMDVP